MIVVDTEVYRDYFLLAALDLDTGKVQHFEMYSGHALDDGIRALMTSRTTVGFNSAGYDLPMIAAAVAGKTCAEIKTLSDSVIVHKSPPWRLGVKIPKTWDHIDLIELAIGRSSLKIYGGRLHAPKMQDLPIEPSASIAPDQREALRRYCVNDLETTAILYRHLRPQIALRETMSKEYGVDLRSKSDAQIAEAVIRTEIERLGGDASKPENVTNLVIGYKDPGFIQFNTQPCKRCLRACWRQTSTLPITARSKCPTGWASSALPLTARTIRWGSADCIAAKSGNISRPLNMRC